MDDAQLERLIERICEGPDLVYAILDGARDPAVRPAVASSDLPHKCLFSGDLSVKLANAAPYLIQIKRSSDSVRSLLKRSWGQSWGIFLASPASLEDLRRHFRRFLRVKDSRGKVLYFRYYDPRVLRIYLPTCDKGELVALFGPVTRFLVEDKDPKQLLEYRRFGGHLDLGVIALTEAPSA